MSKQPPSERNDNPSPPHPKPSTPTRSTKSNQGPDNRVAQDLGAEMVCVTLERPPHFWRFACAAADSRDLLEILADLADTEESAMTWDDAELIASQIVLHHGDDRTQADTEHAR
ncbi:MAG: hypothetical protein AB8C13_02565 [Phycisphaerales bacterium]